MVISKEFRFEASHQIHNHPGKCRRLHGHSWRLTVFCEGPLDPQRGMVTDYADVKELVQPLIDRLDHQHLGNGIVLEVYLPSTVVGLNLDLPTSENLLIWIAQNLPSQLEWTGLKLEETCTSAAYLTRSEYEDMNEQNENSASQETEGTQASNRTEEAAQIAGGTHE